MMKREDRLWKAVMWSFPTEFILFAHPDAFNILDLNRKPEFLDKELEQVYPPEQEQFSTVVADNLIKFYTLKGNNDYVLLHIEIQQKYHVGVGQRMFTYGYRIFDKFQKPLNAWLILTESTRKNRADHFGLDFMGTQIRYRFNTLKIADMADHRLLADNNPFALVVMAAKFWGIARSIKDSLKRDHYLFDKKIKLIELVFSKRLEAHQHSELLNFINYSIRLEDKDIKANFDNRLFNLTKGGVMMTITQTILDIVKEEGKLEGKREGIQEGIQEGRIEGIQEGRIEEKLEIVQEMKKQNIPVDLISRITKLSLREIENISGVGPD